MSDLAAVNAAVLARLAAAEVDLAEAAHHLGLSQPTLVRRLTGRTVLTIVELWRIAKLTDCTLTELVPVAELGGQVPQ